MHVLWKMKYVKWMATVVIRVYVRMGVKARRVAIKVMTGIEDGQNVRVEFVCPNSTHR
jgi:hypothetical protein